RFANLLVAPRCVWMALEKAHVRILRSASVTGTLEETRHAQPGAPGPTRLCPAVVMLAKLPKQSLRFFVVAEALMCITGVPEPANLPVVALLLLGHRHDLLVLATITGNLHGQQGF